MVEVKRATSQAAEMDELVGCQQDARDCVTGTKGRRRLYVLRGGSALVTLSSAELRGCSWGKSEKSPFACGNVANYK